MRIISLCSSSKGNCTYIENNGTGVLIDIGCSYKALCEGLRNAGRDISAVRAVFITHEHIDHIRGLLTLTKKMNIPVYASEGTLTEIIEREKASTTADLRLIDDLGSAPVSFDVKAFHTPHDSAESVCYTLTAGNLKAAVCTDLGTVTDEVRENLLGSRFVLLEANYDLTMLTRNYNYPEQLKARIRSDRGHLSNGDCASFLRELVMTGTTNIMLGHLSPENNTPETARSAAVKALSAGGAAEGRDYLLNVARIVGDGSGVAL